jgi:hypothetical protein
MAVVATVIVLGITMVDTSAGAGEPAIIVFPVAGRNSYRDTFGAARDGGSRSHKGTDIIAARLVPVVAILDGIVTVVGSGRKAGTWIELRHDGGWRSRYLHLNNDSPGTDDGRGRGVASGISVGVAVTAGLPSATSVTQGTQRTRLPTSTSRSDDPTVRPSIRIQFSVVLCPAQPLLLPPEP